MTIKEIREAQGYSQEEFAKILGCSRRTYQDKERGILPFSIRDVIIASKMSDAPVTIKTEEGIVDITIK